MKTLIPILISLVLCGCNKSVVSVTRPYVRGDLKIVECDGHRFAVYDVYDAAGICEVTDASKIIHEAETGPMPIGQTKWWMFKLTYPSDYYAVSNFWYQSGIESHIEDHTVYFKPAK